MQVKLNCTVCEKPYIVPKRYQNSKYCSQECTHEGQKDRQLRICQHCGKQEYIQRALADRPFCSWECKSEYQKKDKILKICENEQCQAEFEVYPCRDEEARFCSQSCAATVNMASFKIGHWVTKRTTRNDLGNASFRSNWEANYARILEHHQIKWHYEPVQFLLSNGRRYTPDFYLPHINKYIEIKGYWYDESVRKFQMFTHEYPDIKIVVVDKPKYLQLEKHYKEIIANWE